VEMGYSCWPTALKTSSNEAEDRSRDEGFLERRRGAEAKRCIYRAVWDQIAPRKRTKPHIQKSGQ